MAILLTYNPAYFGGYEGKNGSYVGLMNLDDGLRISNWTVGRVRNIKLGERCYLISQGKVGNALIASGYIIKTPYQWSTEEDPKPQPPNFINIEFDMCLPVEHGYKRNASTEDLFLWRTRTGGIRVLNETRVEGLWRSFLKINGHSLRKTDWESASKNRNHKHHMELSLYLKVDVPNLHLESAHNRICDMLLDRLHHLVTIACVEFDEDQYMLKIWLYGTISDLSLLENLSDVEHIQYNLQTLL